MCGWLIGRVREKRTTDTLSVQCCSILTEEIDFVPTLSRLIYPKTSYSLRQPKEANDINVKRSD